MNINFTNCEHNTLFGYLEDLNVEHKHNNNEDWLINDEIAQGLKRNDEVAQEFMNNINQEYAHPGPELIAELYADFACDGSSKIVNDLISAFNKLKNAGLLSYDETNNVMTIKSNVKLVFIDDEQSDLEDFMIVD